jgi:hypothetical protein
MTNAAIIDLQFAAQLLHSIEWSVKDGPFRFGVIFILVHPLAVYITSAYISPSLLLNNDSNTSTTGEFLFLTGGMFLVSALLNLYTSAMVGVLTRFNQWTLKKVALFTFIHSIVALVVFTLIAVVVITFLSHHYKCFFSTCTYIYYIYTHNKPLSFLCMFYIGNTSIPFKRREFH